MDEAAAPERVGFRPLPVGGGRTLAVDVSAPEALPAVRALFPDHRPGEHQPAGGHEPGDEPEDAPEVALSLRRARDGYELETPAGVWRGAELGGVLARLELTLAAELVRRSGLRGLHAAGVVLDGGAVLFTGPGGSGKSSLAAGFALRGFPLLGDDVVLFGTGRVHPFRRLLKVEDPARTLLELPDPSEPLASLWPDAALYHPADLGSRWAEPAPVCRVVLPERVEGAGVEIEERPPAEILVMLLRGLVPEERVEPGDFEEAATLLAGVACYRARYGATAAAVAALSAAWG